MIEKKHWLLFDWGNTLMRVFPEYKGPMYSWPKVEVMPGVLDAFAVLQAEWHFALATNATDSREEDIWRALERVKLDTFIDKIYCFHNLGAKKPSRTFFQKILNDLKTLPTSIVMIGDCYESDVQGALQAGLAAIWYNPSGSENQSNSKIRTIHHFKELPRALKALKL